MAHYELNIHDYWRIVKRRRTALLLTLLMVLFSVVIFTNIQTPVYQSTATVKIEPSLVIPGVSTDQQAIWDSFTAVNTEVKTINSLQVAQLTALKMRLINPDDTPDKKLQAAAALQSKISAEKVGDSNLITIAATSSNARETAAVANAAAEVYIEKGIEDRSRHAREFREFIEQQLRDCESKLKKAEESLRSYSEKADVQGTSGILTNRMMDVESRRAELLKKYTDYHPEVLRLNQQIRSIQDQMKQLPREELEYARLSREVKINEELYMLLAKRHKEAQISEADRVQSAFIISPAMVPGSPIKPNRMLNLAAGVFIGLFLGFIVALIVENLDTSIETIEDVEKFLDLPVLGIIPHLEIEGGQKFLPGRFESKKRRIATLRSKLIVHHSQKSPFSESYNTLRTNMNFSFSAAGADCRNAKIISFTSAGIGEGKTLTSSNFSLAAAQSGLKTLLIEVDLRRPSLHWLFGLQRTPGLGDCIIGTRQWRECIRTTTDFLMGDLGADKFLQLPGIENLHILTSGPAIRNPLDLLNAPGTGNLLREMSSEYDLIILDCPPVLLFADALVMGAHAAGTIIVYQVGRMARQALKRAKDQLVNVKVPVLGTVLNNVKTSEIGSYYGYGYNNSYSYYSRDPKSEK